MKSINCQKSFFIFDLRKYLENCQIEQEKYYLLKSFLEGFNF